VQSGPTSRLLSQLVSTEDAPLLIRPIDGAFPVPAGGTIHLSPDGWIVTDPDEVPVAFIGNNGLLVHKGTRKTPVNGDSGAAASP
jgi:hypothetical protein